MGARLDPRLLQDVVLGHAAAGARTTNLRHVDAVLLGEPSHHRRQAVDPPRGRSPFAVVPSFERPRYGHRVGCLAGAGGSGFPSPPITATTVLTGTVSPSFA